jgi:hypothetical protein
MVSVADVPEALGEGIEGATVSSPTSRQIAGVDATCFIVDLPNKLEEGPPGTEKIELCYSDDGKLLFLDRQVTFSDSAFPPARLTVEAQEVGDAAESDFDPIASPAS